jgi:hypothetical protein
MLSMTNNTLPQLQIFCIHKVQQVLTAQHLVHLSKLLPVLLLAFSSKTGAQQQAATMHVHKQLTRKLQLAVGCTQRLQQHKLADVICHLMGASRRCEQDAISCKCCGQAPCGCMGFIQRVHKSHDQMATNVAWRLHSNLQKLGHFPGVYVAKFDWGKSTDSFCSNDVAVPSKYFLCWKVVVHAQGR